MNFNKQLNQAIDSATDIEIHLTLAKEVKDIDIAEILVLVEKIKLLIEPLRETI